jgi:uncharacterized protein YndB with AHSA1/START domain
MNMSDDKTQVYSIYIKASPEKIWEAITQPEWSVKYMYGSLVDYDLKPGGAFIARASEPVKQASREMGYPVPDVMCDGEVVEVDAPKKLVQTWRLTMDESMKAEGFSRVTWELKVIDAQVTKVTVTHEFEQVGSVAVMVTGAVEDTGAGGGWIEVLSGLKTALETGDTLRAG